MKESKAYQLTRGLAEGSYVMVALRRLGVVQLLIRVRHTGLELDVLRRRQSDSVFDCGSGDFAMYRIK